jgi:antitoxin (DNA-binding transcriptional repressor) of toxin-antitoxin stability system
MKRSEPVPIHIAKAQLSKLIARALRGEEVRIARGKVAVVRLQPLEQSSGRVFGSLRGKLKVDASFFDELPDQELKAWEA